MFSVRPYNCYADSSSFTASSSGMTGANENVYLTAHDASEGTEEQTEVYGGCGQLKSPVPLYYYVWRGFIGFDTSGLPDDAVLESAVLKLYGKAPDASDTDFIIRVQNWTEGDATVTETDYDAFDGVNVDDGTFSTSSWSLTGYNTITIVDTSVISKTGSTFLCVRSSRDISSTVPTGNEYVLFENHLETDKEPKLIVTYNSPSVGEFTVSDSSLYGNQPFYLNATVNDASGYVDFVNATVAFTGDIVLKWDNASDVFTEFSDVNGYYTLTSGSSTVLNATGIRLSWFGKLNSYPYSSVDILSANTKVFDSSEASSSGSHSSLFTYSSHFSPERSMYYLTGSVILDRVITIKGSMGNGTAFTYSSAGTGLNRIALHTCYGTASFRIWIGEYVSGTSLTYDTVTSNTWGYIVTSFYRVTSGDYFLFACENYTANIIDWELFDQNKIRAYAETFVGNSVFLDIADWFMPVEPYSVTVDGSSFIRGSQSFYVWSESTKRLTFTVSPGIHTLVFDWSEPESESHGGLPVFVVREDTPEPIDYEDITPEGLGAADNFLTATPYVGIVLIIVIVGAVSIVPSLRNRRGGTFKFKWPSKKASSLVWNPVKGDSIKRKKQKVAKIERKKKKKQKLRWP